MRVLLLTDLYPPSIGGVEQHVRLLGRELAARGHVVAVATVHPGTGLPDEETDGAVRVHRLRSALGRLPGAYEEAARPFAPPMPDPELTLRLGRLAGQFRPHVVHAHGWIDRSWLPVAPGVRAPLVVTAHEYGTVCPRKDLRHLGCEDCSGPSLAKCIGCAAAHYGPVRGVPIVLGHEATAPLVGRLAKRHIAVSRVVAERNRLPAATTEIIPNFLPDDEPVGAAGTERWTSQLPQVPFVLYVGALGAHKGIPVLLDAWSRLGDAPPLVAIGHRWSDTPRDLPPGVTVLEDWPNEAVRAAWARSLFGVIPSVWAEPFGIVALEAMAAGRPVVASRTGGLADVVDDGVTGLLVQPGQPQELAGAIRRLLDDPALRGEMGVAAMARMPAYRASAVVPRIEAVYRAAIRDAARKVAAG
jgi:glycosyltransferase involved in cell wall biosynthesis